MRRRNSFAIIVVGKSNLRREGLARVLCSENLRILASVSSADQLLAVKAQPQQVLYVIVHTGDDFDAAIEQIETLKSHRAGGRIAVVADRYRLDELVSAYRAGANGYFVDVMTCDVFIKSIELVMMGETVFPPALLSALHPEGNQLEAEPAPRDDPDQAILVTPEDGSAPRLSSREKLILRCLIEGDSNKSIARKIGIAEATVKVHVKAILRKVRVHNRTQAAIWGMNNGSLAQTIYGGCSLLPPGPGKHLPAPMETISEIKQAGESIPPCATGREANHVEVPRIDDFIRNGAARLR